ncbi:MAG: family 20 glycosylhydrolase [Bacteroidota bacterium]
MPVHRSPCGASPLLFTPLTSWMPMQVRSLLSLILLLVAVTTLGQAQLSRTFSVIPKPQQINPGHGVFLIDRHTTIYVAKDAAAYSDVAGFFADELRRSTALPLPVMSEGDSVVTHNVIVFSLLAPARSPGPEGYQLTVTPDAIRIAAEAPAGVFYACQTLFQLLPVEFDYGSAVYGVRWGIPAVAITDAPRFPWRGMHLDVGRHFAPKQFVLKYIDLISRYKFNTFHWHLTEDQGWRIEIKKYPRLTDVASWRKETLGDGIPHGGFYTQDEIREVVNYAARRFVTVVPEIEMPGHSTAALAAYPELSCTGGPFQVQTNWGVFEDVYCAGNERTFEFLQDVLTEVMDLFPSTFIHIGGDECPKARWKVCPKCQARIKAEGLKDEHELQSYFVKRIEKFLSSHGRRLVGWDEILEGGLAPNATVMSWRGVQGGIDAAKGGHDVVMTPTSHCYFDYTQALSGEAIPIGSPLTLETVYSYEPVPPELSATEAHHVLGAQGNVWREFMPDSRRVEYMAFPRACALSEVVWSPAASKDFTDFSTRMAVHCERLLRRGVNVRVPSPTGFEGPRAFFRDTSFAIVSPFPGAVVRYTTDGSEPTSASPLAVRSVRARKGLVLKARAFLPGGGMSPVATGYLSRVNRALNGLSYTLVHAVPDNLGDIDRLPVAARGTTTGLGLGGIPLEKDSLTVVFEGRFVAERTGVYTFFVSAYRKAFLSIDGTPVASDTAARWWEPASGKILLAKGAHPLRLTYMRVNRWAGLNVQVEGPGMERQLVPGGMLRKK